MNIEMTFFYYVAILCSIVFAFTIFRVISCKPFNANGEEFQGKKLFLGTVKHLIAISGISLVYVVCSIFGADLVVMEIGGTAFTIPGALNLVMLTTIVTYSVKLIHNATEYFGINNPLKDAKAKEVQPQTTFEHNNLQESVDDVEGARG